MQKMKVPAYSGSLFLSIFLLASTPLLAQTAPAAGTTVAVKMVDTIDSGNDPAGKQYHASVTKAVTAGNGVTIAQGAAALVTLARSGSGYAAQLSSVTINGQQVAVTSNSASVSAAAQSAAGSSAASAVNSVLGGFGRRVSAPASVAAAATGQHVSLPTGTTLTFVLGNPPAANTAAATAPAAPAAQTMTASAAPAPSPASGSGGAAAPGQDWWMCSYRDVKDPYKPALGSLMYYALISASGTTDEQAGITTHFVGYVRQNYKVNDNATAGAVGAGRCQRFSNDPASRANSLDMSLKQWASSNIESIHVNWTNTPAENAAIDAKLAGAASAAATAAATLTAAANQNYAWCSSEWAGTAGTMMPAGTVMYFSDVFPATLPPQPPTQKTGNGSAQIAAQSAVSTPFSAFLQKKYGYKYGVRCAVTYPPTLAGQQDAQKYKQQFEDLATHNNGQIVETGWKNP